MKYANQHIGLHRRVHREEFLEIQATKAESIRVIRHYIDPNTFEPMGLIEVLYKDGHWERIEAPWQLKEVQE